MFEISTLNYLDYSELVRITLFVRILDPISRPKIRWSGLTLHKDPNSFEQVYNHGDLRYHIHVHKLLLVLYSIGESKKVIT